MAARCSMRRARATSRCSRFSAQSCSQRGDPAAAVASAGKGFVSCRERALHDRDRETRHTRSAGEGSVREERHDAQLSRRSPARQRLVGGPRTGAIGLRDAAGTRRRARRRAAVIPRATRRRGCARSKGLADFAFGDARFASSSDSAADTLRNDAAPSILSGGGTWQHDPWLGGMRA